MAKGRRRQCWPNSVAYVLFALSLGALGANYFAGIRHQGDTFRTSSEISVLERPGYHGQVDVSTRSLEPVHVCFCTDDSDLRALLVAIKTTVANAVSPQRLVFHLVVPSSSKVLFSSLLPTLLPIGTQIRVYTDDVLEAKIISKIEFKSWPGLFRSLATPFNFVSFYLDQILSQPVQNRSSTVKKVVYLDTDVVVQGDIAELFDLSLDGKPVGAVTDCFTKNVDLFSIIDLAEMAKITLDPEGCIALRGVHVIDLKVWETSRYADKFEKLLHIYSTSEGPLWHHGFSTPLWLLTIMGNFKEIDASFHCANLGAPIMGLAHASDVRKLGFDHDTLINNMSVAIDAQHGTMKPFIASCTTEAKVLHFSGTLKPWYVGKWSGKWSAPLCFASGAQTRKLSSSSPTWVAKLKKGSQAIIRCFELWSRHMSKEEACLLKDVDREWAEEEQNWHEDYAKKLKDDEEEQAGSK